MAAWVWSPLLPGAAVQQSGTVYISGAAPAPRPYWYQLSRRPGFDGLGDASAAARIGRDRWGGITVASGRRAA